MQIAKPSRRRIAIAVLALLAGLMVWRLVLRPAVFDRTYKGRDLLAWTKDWEEERGFPARRERARAAIRVLCSSSLPELVQALELDPMRRAELIQSLKPRRLRDWVQSLPQARNWVTKGAQDVRANVAVSALRALGDDAAPVIPQITNLLANTNYFVRIRVYLALPVLGTNGFGCFRSILADEKHPRRAEAARWVAVLKDDLGTNAMVMLMPALLRCLNAADPEVVSAAADTVGMWGLEPEFSVPALAGALTNTSSDVRLRAVQALGQFGANATAAIPALTRALEDPAQDVREETTNTLWNIQNP